MIKKTATQFFVSLVCLFTISVSAQQVPTPDHVVVVVLENHGYDDIIGSSSAPYINSLGNDSFGALFTQSFGMTHPSQPNYMYLFSGDNQNVILDFTPISLLLPFSTSNLGASLLQNGKTFVGYSEDLPSIGYTGDASGAYHRKHAPWVNWQDGTTNGIPAALNQPLTSFPSNYDSLPTLSFLIPNQDHDMHDGTIGQADTFLQTHIDSYVQWAKTHNSLLILTFDEDDGVISNNQIATIFIGQMVKHGQYNETIDHNRVLRTMESMYNLPYAGGSANSTDIVDCWVYKPIAGLTATPLSVCPGQSINVSDVSTNVPTSWQWSFPGGTPASSSLQNASVIYPTSGIFDITLIATNQMGSDTLLLPAYVTVHANPTLTLSSDTISICLGDTVSVTASGASVYYWFSSPTTVYSVGNTLTVIPTSDTEYELLGTDFGCVSDTAHLTVHVDSLLSPAVNISVSPDTIVCSGSVVTFNAVAINGGNNPVYQWKVNGTPAGQDSFAFSTYTLSDYTVSCLLTSSASCANPLNAMSDVLHISISPLLVPQITAIDSALWCTVANGYQWYLNGQPINGANAQNYIASVSGWYKVEVLNAQGCSSFSDSVLVSMSITGVANISSSLFSVYPNPNSGVLFVYVENNGSGKIEVSDILGNVTYQYTISAKDNLPLQVSTTQWEKGVYFIHLTQDSKHQTQRILID